MTKEELLYTLALTKIPGIGIIGARHLFTAMNGAANVFRYRKELPDKFQGISKKIVEALDCPAAFECAEKELLFIEKNEIKCLVYGDEAYPSRLLECDDAPIVLYFRGECDLNSLHVISVVGTRHATNYGTRLCTRFLEELKELCPHTLIVSGLAYGIDVCAHQASLSCGLPTVGVLAHGLDRIYPAVHRNLAVSMLAQGGLLTEYMSGTSPDRQNFVRRNRIVAGISDATLVVESAAKGGALITADIAQSYHRDCFAFPGRATDEFSTGCNNLIRDNKASLIRSAEDFVKAMSWDRDKTLAPPSPIQRQFFPDLSEEEQKIVEILQKEGSLQINTLVVEANIPINRMSALLFELEMNGIVRPLAGGMYQLV